MRVIKEKIAGLTNSEAKHRLLKFGFNEIPADKSKKLYKTIWEIVSEPMVGLLIACGTIYLLLGDALEAIVLLFSVFGVVGITLYQSRKSEKSLEALRNLSSPRAFVIREGVEIRIPGREVVPGDSIILIEGDRIPADADILECTNLLVDESLLSGESVPVNKKVGSGAKNKNDSQVFSGSMVVKGHAVAQVFATGLNTGVGKIGKSLQSLAIEKTLLQKEVSKVIKYIALLGLFLCTLLVIFYALTRGDLLSGFLAGLTLAMGILPEEFPIVLTLFITMGAYRLAKSQVLARRAATIETLGAASVLCVDKTGTLTENKMKVEEIYQDTSINISEKSYPLDELTYYLVLSSQKNPFDPMENAFLDLRKKIFKDLPDVYDGMDLVGEYPVQDKSLALIHVWATGDGNKHEVAAKGAPEAIFALCDMDKKDKEMYEAKVEEMAKRGLRVLAIGRGEYIGKSMPKDRNKFKLEFLGLVGLLDPVRKEVHHAISECYSAGIRVIMITGDYPATAENIAHRIGLASPGGVLTGDDIDKMSDTKLNEKIDFVNIFTRVTPANKLRIVEALKEKGEIVAMTGDGVNDAPALKAAYIGIAMGERGTDVAREAAALVLLDDDFSSIVGGVKLGRRIFDNLKKAIKYLFTIHVPIVGLSLIPVIFKWPLVLYPIHIVLLELIIDPACTLVFEAEKEEEDIMQKKPRKIKDSIFSRPMVVSSIVEGLIILVITVATYKLTLDLGWSPDKARAFTFLVLAISNFLLILSNRSEVDSAIKRLIKTNNKPFYAILTIFIIFITFIYLNPWTRNIFRFAPISVTEGVIAVGLGAISIIWLEIVKLVKRLF